MVTTGRAIKICIFFLQEPQEIVLSQHAEYHVVKGRQRLRIVKETYHYIPIVKTLQALLKHPEVLSEVTYSFVITKDMGGGGGGVG